MLTERRENESELAYHRRIIYGKLVDKTLADMDYTELAELVYGRSYSSDVARRMFYGSRRTLELIDSLNGVEWSEREEVGGEAEDASRELDEKIGELRRERQKLCDQRREYNRMVSAEAREEHLYDSLIACAENLSESVGLVYGDLMSGRSSASDGETEAVLVYSDWHFGLKTSNIFNTYNTDICRERVRRVTEAAAKRMELHGCRKLHVVVLGDLFHGAIHTSARVAAEELVCDQIMQASEILAQSIEYLSCFAEETVVYVTYGNHARTVQNKNDSIHRDNMERLVPWWLKQRLSAHESISVAEDSGNEFLFINACGHWIGASHGDNDSVKSSPSLLTALFQKKRGVDIEYILLGDRHHRESFDELGVTAMLCGALCGTDDYANDKRLYSEPSQLLLIVDKENGVDAEYRLRCG